MMSAFFSLIGIKGLLAGVAAIVVFVWGMWMKHARARAERDKQIKARIKAIEVADQVDNDVGALPKGEAREELRKWGK